MLALLKRSPIALLAGIVAVLGLWACARPGAGGLDRRVIVMPFANSVAESADTALGKSLADMMTANLANYPRVAVVDRPDAAVSGGGDWRKVGRQTGVDYVVVGSISKLNNNFVVLAMLNSTATGEVVKGSAVRRSCDREEDLYPVVQAMSRALAENLYVLSERYEAWSAQKQ